MRPDALNEPEEAADPALVEWCAYCGAEDGIQEYEGKNLCSGCRGALGI